MILVLHPLSGVCLGAVVERAPADPLPSRIIWAVDCNTYGGIVKEFNNVTEATNFLAKGGINFASASCVSINVRDINIRPRISGATPVSECTTGAEGTLRVANLLISRG